MSNLVIVKFMQLYKIFKKLCQILLTAINRELWFYNNCNRKMSIKLPCRSIR
jgi:hypothetical protein